MTTGELLLAAVDAAPADDGPRLAYADWVYDHGDPALGEFILVQCELARLAAGADEPDGDTRVAVDAGWAARERRVAGLRGREKALLNDHHRRWVRLPGAPAGSVRHTVFWHLPGDSVAAVLEFRRGFPDALSLTPPAFGRVAAAAYRAHPTVAAVHLTGAVHPREYGGGDDRYAVWRHEVAFLWDILCPGAGPDVEFVERRDAGELAAALSAAAVTYGRAAAGLPARAGA